MSDFDLVIRNGRVATSTEVLDVDIGIRDGRIAALGPALGSGAGEIDAAGLIVTPGGIDSHVHIAQPQAGDIVLADDFASGTLSALCGGNTMVLPFCQQERGRPMREALNAYHAKAEGNCYCDVSFHMIIVEPTAALLGQELPALVAAGYRSFKVFMTYEALRLSDLEILRVLDVARETGATVMVHCENEDAIRFLIEKHEARGDVAPRFHATTRPVVAEREATHRALSLSELVDVPLVIVHVSNRAAMEEIRRGRERGQTIIAETCPQYLLLTEEDLAAEGWEGAKFVCSPPPRDRENQIACWEGLMDGTFSLFSSDHCPYRFDDPQGKLNPDGRRSFRHIPNGIPGVETRLPILFSEGVTAGRLSLPEFVRLSSTNHAQTYGLYPAKGEIAIGSDADLVLWDPERRGTIRQENLHHGSDYTPYEGHEITGWPVRVLLRGTVVIENGAPVGDAPQGRYVSRT